ncbi:hypothetical protein GCM10023215_15400 [Pseudonocardia yuanmonensis]|uniref:Uncharacterized protein n=1 Tax=Pseudonocardia yuanmonensis TaxID=1095914 RepID=A0ABP8W753_9PSEU
MVEYTCSGAHEGAGEHTWLVSQVRAGWTAETEDGVTDELLGPLLDCVLPGEPYVEFGIVEFRLRESRPDLFRAHVADRGHVMLAPGIATASSVRFGTALGRLARSGDLLSRYGAATGAWKYNGQVSYWARPPAPSGSLSWAEHCEHLGRSPEWTDDDRAAARGSDSGS